MTTTPPPNFIGSLTTLDAHAIYRVNGVPIWENNTLGGENLCSSGPLAGWMITGPNTIEIEVRETGPKAVVEAQAGVQGEEFFAPLEHQYAWKPGDRSGGRFVIEAPAMPQWNWVKADAWDGKDQEIIDLLNRVRDAIGKKDKKFLSDLMISRLRDVEVLYGPLDPEMIEGSIEEYLQAVPELREPLKVERFHDGKIIRATGGDSKEPLIVKNDAGEITSMMGQWWTRVGGQWQVLN